MDVFAERCAGLDIGKADLKACVRVPAGRGKRRQEVRTFRTTTPGLLMLRDWLVKHQVSVVGMESTGVYWKPVFYILESAFTCWLLNPLQVKKVPGRKTDVTDAQWITQLVEFGLVRASFVPPPPIRVLRDLTRYRTSLVRDRTREVQRLHAVLEDAGIKLSTVASDVLGVSGRAMLAALINGQRDPIQMADLAKGRMRGKVFDLEDALTGFFTAHHGRLVSMMLAQIDTYNAHIADLETQIEDAMRPFSRIREHLKTIPGIGDRASAAILGEIGIDMSRFPTPADLVSWAGLCPGNNESAGRHLSTATRKGNTHLRAVLYESAAAASHTRRNYLSDKYGRLAYRRGKQRALVALSRILLETCWHLITNDTHYRDLGPHYLENLRDPLQRARQLTRQLNKIGYDVTLTPRTAA